MFVNDIERLGLTEKEAKLYVTSLRIGPSSMQTLAAKSHIDRGTAYHVAKTLRQKGLFHQISGGKRPLFGVTDPQQFFSYVEEQKRQADAHYEAMQEVIGDLKSLYKLYHSE
jgi:HTH-type transcriptional regulator, sugar sensing transcriptional regulator